MVRQSPMITGTMAQKTLTYLSAAPQPSWSTVIRFRYGLAMQQQ